MFAPRQVLRLQKEVPRIDPLHISFELSHFPYTPVSPSCHPSHSVHMNVCNENHVTTFATAKDFFGLLTQDRQGWREINKIHKEGSIEHCHLHHP